MPAGSFYCFFFLFSLLDARHKKEKRKMAKQFGKGKDDQGPAQMQIKILLCGPLELLLTCISSGEAQQIHLSVSSKFSQQISAADLLMSMKRKKGELEAS